MISHPTVRQLAWFAVLFICSCSDWERYPVDVHVGGPPPARIEDASLVVDSLTGDVSMTWMVPPTTNGASAIAQYEIRYVYNASFNWEAAIPVVDPPAPLPAGEPQSYTFRYPRKGFELKAAVVGIDGAGARSPVSNVVATIIPGPSFDGLCQHVYSGTTLENLDVTIERDGLTFVLQSNAFGQFSKQNLVPGSIAVSMLFDPPSPTYFDIRQQFLVIDDISHTFQLIPFENSEILTSVHFLDLFRLATLTDGSGSRPLLKWKSIPVPTYIPEFVNVDGLDYAQAARDAAQRWMDRTGVDLFVFVGEPPESGIAVHPRPRAEMGIQIGITRHSQDDDGFPSRDDIDILDSLDDPGFLYKVLLHEFGHTIRLGHLPSPDFIMYAALPLPEDISDDEVKLVKLHAALLNGTDMSVYDAAE